MTFLITAGAVAAVLAVTFAIALKLGRHSVIDVAWGLGFVAVALVGYFVSDGDPATRLLVLVLVAVWGVRLAVHIGLRARGHGEDPRYVKLLSRARGNRTLYALKTVYLPQGLALWFISLPVQFAQREPDGLNWISWIGVAVWAVGFAFEAIGDWQLTRFKADPANRGRVLNTGLWRYTRHPNYFGDACVWWGIFLVAAAHFPGCLTILSPLLMTYTLMKVTGKPVLERQLGEKPGYAEYIRSTSGFIPLPPRSP